MLKLVVRRSKYAEIGCKKELLRKDLKQHENDGVLHLHFAVEVVSEHRKEISEQRKKINKQQEEISELQKEMSSQRRAENDELQFHGWSSWSLCIQYDKIPPTQVLQTGMVQSSIPLPP